MVGIRATGKLVEQVAFGCTYWMVQREVEAMKLKALRDTVASLEIPQETRSGFRRMIDDTLVSSGPSKEAQNKVLSDW